MNRSGVGQIITTAPVLVLVFVVMVIFVILAGVIGGVDGVKGNLNDDKQIKNNVNSRVLLELFLGSFVVIDGEKVKVEDVLKQIIDSTESSVIELARLLEVRFDEAYSCGGKNEILYKEYSSCGISGDPCTRTYMDYPNTRIGDDFPIEEKVGFSGGFGVYPQNDLGASDGYYFKEIGITDEGEGFILSVKGEVKC